MRNFFTLFLTVFLINSLWAQTNDLMPLGGLPCQPFFVQLNNQLLSHPLEDSVITKACPSDLITLAAEAVFNNNNINYLQTQSNTKFIWKFDNMYPDTNVIVNRSFYQPTIKNYSLIAIDVNGCPSLNVFKGKILVSGTPIISINPFIYATSNTPIYVTAGNEENATLLFEPINIQSNPISINYMNYDTVLIPDGDGICYYDDLLITYFENDQLLESVDQIKGILLNMEHSYLNDLSIKIICPNGSSTVLKALNQSTPTESGIIINSCSSNGGSRDLGCAPRPSTSALNYTSPGIGWNYEFRPGATGCFGSTADTVVYAYTDQLGEVWNGPAIVPSYSSSFITTPYTPVFYGSYETLDNLIGCPLNGNWRIKICDHLAVDNGYIFNWGIKFNESLQDETVSYSVLVDSARFEGPNVTPTGPFSAIIQNNDPGISSYIVTLIDEFGCEYDADFSVHTVLRVDDFDNESPIKFYPNPTSSFVHIINESEPIKMIQLYSVNGMLLLEQYSEGFNQILDLSLYQSGIYICKVTSSKGETKQVKIIKK